MNTFVPVTTMAVGEEEPPTTTMAVGEEGTPYKADGYTTLSLGEEDPTTLFLGEETPTTLSLGEEQKLTEETDWAGSPFGAF
jgi:hypothetical protein